MDVLSSLIDSLEPVIRYKTMHRLLQADCEFAEEERFRDMVRQSPLVEMLLAGRDESGRIPLHPYQKWCGAHWVLSCLADLDYPPGDERLKPLLEQVYNWLLSSQHLRGVKVIAKRARHCASQEGNALYASLALGLADARSQELAERLMRWRWPDGGWNCDKDPSAQNSSFMESLIPLRALALYANCSGDPKVSPIVQSSAEVFLKRQMYLRQRDHSIIDEDFTHLHYPCYWHYDILFGLKVMAEVGLISDLRCQMALDLLEAKRLPEGGFPLERRFFKLSAKVKSGSSLVDWSKYHLPPDRKANAFVTLDALYVLQGAGRIKL